MIGKCDYNQSSSCQATNNCITMCDDRQVIQEQACNGIESFECQDVVDHMNNE